MDSTTAESLSKQLQISLPYIVREEYEIVLLRELAESEYGARLVFRGGTALRLAYNSPRFSEDLDFSLVAPVKNEEFIAFLKNLGKQYPGVAAIEANEKFYTLFGLVKIKEPYMEKAFSIKIEISKRVGEWIKGKDYSERVLRSQTTPLTPLVYVASIERILEEKKDAMRHRKTSRDVFDYWYIHQLQKKDIQPDFTGYDKREAKVELHKLLTRSYWRVVDTWLA